MSESKFILNPEALALALGLKLFGQRVRKAAQIDACLKLESHPHFPARLAKNGGSRWPAASVQAFAAAWLELSKDKRSFKVLAQARTAGNPASSIQHPASPKEAAREDSRPTGEQKAEGGGQKSEPELPAQRKPASEEDLFINLTAEQKLNVRLDRLEDMYLRPHLYETKIAQWEKNELKEYRPHIFKKGGELAEHGEAGDMNWPIYCNQGQLGDFYKKRWPDYNINVYKQKITHWQAKGGLPAGAPGHPTPDNGGRYKLADCFAWFEKWMLPKYRKARTPELPGVPETEEAIDLIALRERDERDQIAHNRWERAKEQGEYVHKTVALATGVAAVKRIHQLVKTEDERNLTKMRAEHLQAMGVAVELAQQFQAWDIELARTVTDKREEAMAAIGEEIGKAKN